MTNFVNIYLSVVPYWIRDYNPQFPGTMWHDFRMVKSGERVWCRWEKQEDFS